MVGTVALVPRASPPLPKEWQQWTRTPSEFSTCISPWPELISGLRGPSCCGHLCTPKAFPVHDSINAVSKEAPSPWKAISGVFWGVPSGASSTLVCWSFQYWGSRAGLWGCVHLMVGNNPRKRVVLLATRTVLSPQAFCGIARCQAFAPSEAWLWLLVVIISWRTSPILYTFQTNLLRAGSYPGGSWRGEIPS